MLEAFQAFVARAKDSSYGLHGAIYEFQWPAALKAIKDAAGAGARVHILYDAIPGRLGPVTKNEDAIAAAGTRGALQPETTGKIMHNKFIVLTKNGKPLAVWTGSTNLTENGIFGHSNCGHVIEDPNGRGLPGLLERAEGQSGHRCRETLDGAEQPQPAGPLDR